MCIQPAGKDILIQYTLKNQIDYYHLSYVT